MEVIKIKIIFYYYNLFFLKKVAENKGFELIKLYI